MGLFKKKETKKAEIITVSGTTADGKRILVINNERVIILDKEDIIAPPTPVVPEVTTNEQTEKKKKSFWKFWDRSNGKSNDELHVMLWDKGTFIHSIFKGFETNSDYIQQIDDTKFTIEEKHLYTIHYGFFGYDWWKNRLGILGKSYFVILNKETKQAINYTTFAKTKVDGRSLYLAFSARGLRKGWFDSFKEKFALHLSLKIVILAAIGIGILVGIIYYLSNIGVIHT